MAKFTVQQMMTKQVVVANPTHTFSQLVELFTRFPIRHIPVVDENHKLIGIVSTNDILKLFTDNKYETNTLNAEALNGVIAITDLMTPNPTTVSPDMDVFDAAEMLRKRKFQALPVVAENGDLIGIVSIKDMLDYFVEKAEGFME